MTTTPMRVMVTGGAGYVGSHFVRALLRAGHLPVVVDDLSTGHRDTVPEGVAFRQGSVENELFVEDVIREHNVDAVAHFAARTQVAESVRDPRRYYQVNLRGTMALLEAMLDSGVRTLVATSSAAVYRGRSQGVYGCMEGDDPHPSNPYGETKLAAERMLADYRRAYGLRYAALRCFNVAGAAPGLAERHHPETHLIPLVLAAIEREDAHFTVFGGDYPTPDGTAVRDYVHVLDVADAHLAALEHLLTDGEGGVFNVGSGVGHSVMEVVRACSRVTGKTIPVAYGPRRDGDPPILVADVQRAMRGLVWRPGRSSLEGIVRDAWEARR
jgi:UDP-glucose-4-epimerase GalE